MSDTPAYDVHPNGREIEPGDIVTHCACPDQADNREGVVVMVLTERRLCGTITYCDVRWSDKDGQYTDGTTRHDPRELVIVGAAVD